MSTNFFLRAVLPKIGPAHAALARYDGLMKIRQCCFLLKPIFQSADFVQRSGIPKQSALPFLRTLRETKVLQVLREASGRRSAVFAFRELLNCAEGREVF